MESKEDQGRKSNDKTATAEKVYEEQNNIVSATGGDRGLQEDQTASHQQNSTQAITGSGKIAPEVKSKLHKSQLLQGQSRRSRSRSGEFNTQDREEEKKETQTLRKHSRKPTDVKEEIIDTSKKSPQVASKMKKESQSAENQAVDFSGVDPSKMRKQFERPMADFAMHRASSMLESYQKLSSHAASRVQSSSLRQNQSSRSTTLGPAPIHVGPMSSADQTRHFESVLMAIKQQAPQAKLVHERIEPDLLNDPITLKTLHPKGYFETDASFCHNKEHIQLTEGCLTCRLRSDVLNQNADQSEPEPQDDLHQHIATQFHLALMKQLQQKKKTQTLPHYVELDSDARYATDSDLKWKTIELSMRLSRIFKYQKQVCRHLQASGQVYANLYFNQHGIIAKSLLEDKNEYPNTRGCSAEISKSCQHSSTCPLVRCRMPLEWLSSFAVDKQDAQRMIFICWTSNLMGTTVCNFCHLDFTFIQVLQYDDWSSSDFVLGSIPLAKKLPAVIDNSAPVPRANQNSDYTKLRNFILNPPCSTVTDSFCPDKLNKNIIAIYLTCLENDTISNLNMVKALRDRSTASFKFEMLVALSVDVLDQRIKASDAERTVNRWADCEIENPSTYDFEYIKPVLGLNSSNTAKHSYFRFEKVFVTELEVNKMLQKEVDRASELKSQISAALRENEKLYPTAKVIIQIQRPTTGHILLQGIVCDKSGVDPIWDEYQMLNDKLQSAANEQAKSKFYNQMKAIHNQPFEPSTLAWQEISDGAMKELQKELHHLHCISNQTIAHQRIPFVGSNDAITTFQQCFSLLPLVPESQDSQDGHYKKLLLKLKESDRKFTEALVKACHTEKKVKISIFACLSINEDLPSENAKRQVFLSAYQMKFARDTRTDHFTFRNASKRMTAPFQMMEKVGQGLYEKFELVLANYFCQIIPEMCMYRNDEDATRRRKRQLDLRDALSADESLGISYEHLQSERALLFSDDDKEDYQAGAATVVQNAWCDWGYQQNSSLVPLANVVGDHAFGYVNAMIQEASMPPNHSQNQLESHAGIVAETGDPQPQIVADQSVVQPNINQQPLIDNQEKAEPQPETVQADPQQLN